MTEGTLGQKETNNAPPKIQIMLLRKKREKEREKREKERKRERKEIKRERKERKRERKEREKREKDRKEREKERKRWKTRETSQELRMLSLSLFCCLFLV